MGRVADAGACCVESAMLVAVAGCAERSTRQTVVLAGLAVLVQWAAEAYLGGWVHVETRQARTLLGNRVRSGHSVVVLQTGSAVREISVQVEQPRGQVEPVETGERYEVKATPVVPATQTAVLTVSPNGCGFPILNFSYRK